MPVYDTPWGPRLYTEEMQKQDEVLFAELAKQDEEMSLISFYHHDTIKKYEDKTMTTMDLIEWMMSEDEEEYNDMMETIDELIGTQQELIAEVHTDHKQYDAEVQKTRGITGSEKTRRKKEYVEQTVTPRLERLNETLRKHQTLKALAGKTPEGEPTNAGLDFERAKLVPIDSLIEFKRGFAPCLWHNERTPSMKYYPKNNKVHCFGCGAGGDAIDVVQQMRDCDIKAAVRFLTET